LASGNAIRLIRDAKAKGFEVTMFYLGLNDVRLNIERVVDGNGRTARMLATYLLHRGGFGLKGLFVLENFYDRNLAEYYRVISHFN
jgi:hypothetical protein